MDQHGSNQAALIVRAYVGMRRLLLGYVRGSSGTSESGFLLAETAAALAVFGLLGFAVLSGVQTSNIAKGKFELGSTVENIVRNQLEYVFQQTYVNPGGSYVTVTTPAGYAVSAEAVSYDTDTKIEIVRVRVVHGAETIRTFDTLRVKR